MNAMWTGIAGRGRALLVLVVLLLVATACGAEDTPGAGDGADEPGATDGGGDGAEEGETISMTVGTENEAVLPYAQLMQNFFVPELEQRVAEETPHTLDITEAYGTIAAPGEALAAVETALLDIGAHSCFCLTPRELYPYMVGFHVPFSTPDPEIALPAFRKVLDEVPEMGQIYEENHNQRLLAIYGSSDYGLLTKFPVETIDDIAGHSLSAVGPNLDWIPEGGDFNVTVVQGTLPEWYTGLQTGLFDGVIIHAEGGHGFSLEEVTDYYTIGGFGALAWGSVNINLDTFESLPADVQDILLEVSAEYESRYIEEIASVRDEALAAMEEAGVEISEFDPQVREDWAAALPELPARNVEEAESLGFDFAREVYQTYIDAQEEAGYEFPRDWDLGG